jgi:glycosyltransferase involved in cell wall biosynthesis
MRVAIDARELQGQPTGVGRVLAGILEAWRALPEAGVHEFVLCSPSRDGAGGTLWEQFTLPRLIRKARADVLFAPAYTGPVASPVPVVAAVYDVSFAAHPEWFGRREGVRRRVLTGLTARRAARVITSSEFSRREISRHLGVDPARIDVVYPGVTPASPGSSNVAREDLVLFVGSLFTRRHVPELIDAFGRLAREHPRIRLDIVGDNRTTPRVDFEHLANASAAGARVSLRSYVSDDTLATLYSRARAFVFLSEYEGFGFTPLEALSAGVPIVVLDTAVAREVYGDAALYLSAPDPALIQAALDRLLHDEGERNRILMAAAALLPRYSWNRCASSVLQVLERAAR